MDATHPTTWPELMTPEEVCLYLRLADSADDLGAVGQGGALEQLRRLIRRQGLPHIRRGRLLRFRRSAIDNWLLAAERGRRSLPPGRMQAG